MIVAVYGTCDEFDVVFEPVGGDRWETNVPADYSDGRYVAEFYAQDAAGFLVRWAGILYMYDGKAVFLEAIRSVHKVMIGTTDDRIEAWMNPSVVEVYSDGQGTFGNPIPVR